MWAFAATGVEKPRGLRSEPAARRAHRVFRQRRASQADHLAAELVGRYAGERSALPAASLATSGAGLTALGNDDGYEEVFARQVEAGARPGDVAIVLSTSGRSANVARGLVAARRRGCVTALLTGDRPREALPETDHVIAVPAHATPAIQDLHLFFGHLLYGIIEAEMASGRP